MGTRGRRRDGGLAVLLQEGIGDTIRVSLTPEPGEARTQEVVVALEVLQALGLRRFVPSVTACPGCGRTTATTFQDLAKQIDDYLARADAGGKTRYPGRGDEGRGDGLHSSTAPARASTRNRHQPARHRRGAGRARLHRRREGADAARRDIAAEFQTIVEGYIEKRFGT